MKTLSQHITEKLVINKNYNYISLDDIYDLDWDLNQYGLFCRDKENVASNTFYKYFVNSAKKKISFAQQCRYANDVNYLCASKEVGNGSHLMYLFHLNDTYNKTDFSYSKFMFIPIHDGMRIKYYGFLTRGEMYSLSRKSFFSTKDLAHEYYLVSKDTWDEIETLYKNLYNRQ